MHQTVFVIDDDDAVRDALVFLFRVEGLTSRAFPSAQTFLDALEPGQHGCVVTDLRMPGMDGMALVRSLAQRECVLPVIVITGHGDVPMAVEAMKAGVSDFIVKPFQSETVTAAVRRALDYDESRSAKEAYRAEVKRRLAALTPREREVLVHLSDGLSNKEIGIALNISWRTVESYRARVMQKMQAQSLSELLRMQLSLAARED